MAMLPARFLGALAAASSSSAAAAPALSPVTPLAATLTGDRRAICRFRLLKKRGIHTRTSSGAGTGGAGGGGSSGDRGGGGQGFDHAELGDGEWLSPAEKVRFSYIPFGDFFPFAFFLLN